MVGWWDEPVFGLGGASSFDLPVVVVEEEMVVFAEEQSVGDVGAAVVSGPVLDVVGFAPGGWSVASGPEAAAVAFGEGGALAWGEESVFAPDVEGVAVAVEDDGDRALGAGEALDSCDRDGLLRALQTPVTGACDELLFRDRDPYRRSTVTQQLTRCHLGAGRDQVEEDIGGQLLGAARVVDDLLGSFGVASRTGADETGTAAARRCGPVIDLGDH